jgi:hypothetical protein
LDKVNTADAATTLAGPGRTPFQAKGRLQRWANAGILPALGKVGAGSRSSWIFDRRVVACAAILFELYDRAGVTDPAQLKAIYAYLAEPSEPGRPPLIEEIMADAVDGAPVLVLTQWIGPRGEPTMTVCVRLEAELSHPIMAPSNDHRPVLEGVLSLAPVLDRIIESKVIPFPTSRAVS